jgi:hypothetical protein
MTLGYQRPTDIDDHPIVRKRYLVPTPTIDLVTDRVVKQIRLRNPGAILYGYPRFGKTSSIRYVIHYLGEKFPGAVCVNFRCETHKSGSEDSFLIALLSAVGHKEPLAGKISRKRIRLLEYICMLADRSGKDWIVFFADEAQKLQVIEYEWLRDLHDALELKGIRMITILVGQPQLLDQKSALRHSKDTQIVLRFMVTEIRFGGISSPEDVATCLQAYDESCYPPDSAWTFTRFFYPRAHAAGLQLSTQATALWRAFERAHKTAAMSAPMEIPMAYFARAVEHALSEHSVSDSESFCFSMAIWDEAVLESNYVLACEEIKQGLPLPEWR